MSEICWMSATELLSAYKKGRLSPVEVVKTLLARVDEINPKINALVTRTDEMALAAARESEIAFQKGKPKPLESVPIAIKDNVFTKGVRTTFGSKLYENFVPDRDAVLVERLKNAGAVILANHGVLSVGRDMREALTICELAEEMAKIYVSALSLGKVNVLPTEAFELEKAFFVAIYGESEP